MLYGHATWADSLALQCSPMGKRDGLPDTASGGVISKRPCRFIKNLNKPERRLLKFIREKKQLSLAVQVSYQSTPSSVFKSSSNGRKRSTRLLGTVQCLIAFRNGSRSNTLKKVREICIYSDYFLFFIIIQHFRLIILKPIFQYGKLVSQSQ